MAVKRSRIAFLVQPWAGLAGGVCGWLAHHQLISDSLHFVCPAGNSGSAVALGIAAVVFIALAALWSWAVLREDDSPPGARRKATSRAPRRAAQRDAAGTRAFAARLSLMAAALFALLVMVQTMAGLMLPGCAP